LESFLENMAQQTIFNECEIVLDHNEPSEKELEVVKKFQQSYPNALIHNIVEKVVPVSLSFNTCLDLASGEYLCVGNVDDHRTSNSIENLCETLENNPHVDFTYGDFIIVDSIGKRKGVYIDTVEFNKREFMRGYLIGPFYMFRRNIVPLVGYIDEQWKACADYDFAIRLALSCDGKKTKDNLGYYLNIGQGATTGGSHVTENMQPIERTAIELRYGLYDKTIELNGYPYLKAARRYRLDQMLVHGMWQPVEKYVPNYRNMLIERAFLRPVLEKEYRKWFVRHYTNVPYRAKDTIRCILVKLGLLDKIYTVMKKQWLI
jgi:hypothetical protein